MPGQCPVKSDANYVNAEDEVSAHPSHLIQMSFNAVKANIHAKHFLL